MGSGRFFLLEPIIYFLILNPTLSFTLHPSLHSPSPNSLIPIFAYSHIRIFPHSHIPTFAYSHIRIFPHSHIPIFAYSHIRIFPHSHIPLFPYSHIRIFPYSHIRHLITCHLIRLHVESNALVLTENFTNPIFFAK